METHQQISLSIPDKAIPIVQKISYPEKQQIRLPLREDQIIFVLEGKINFSYDNSRKRLIHDKVFLFLPSMATCILDIQEKATLCVIRIPNKLWVTHWFSIQKLRETENRISEDFFTLEINEKIHIYLQSLLYYLEDGSLNAVFYELKAKEFFFLLKKYYPKEEIAGFFFPLLNSDTYFVDFILDNYLRVKTIKELALLNNQSVALFEKEFRRIFHQSPYQWIKQKRLNKEKK